MRRIFTLLVVTVMVLCCFGTAYAANEEPYRASITLSRYSADLFRGDSSGKAIISYDVKSNSNASSIGVESIVFYTDDGNYVSTVTGTTSNGLVKTNDNHHNDDFECTLPSGNYYYAEVTIFARIGSAYDSRTVTTSTVWIG